MHGKGRVTASVSTAGCTNSGVAVHFIDSSNLFLRTIRSPQQLSLVILKNYQIGTLNVESVTLRTSQVASINREGLTGALFQ